jgi:hypothetical protein
MSFEHIEIALLNNVQDVYRLVEFDQVILNIAIAQLKLLEQKLAKDHFIDNPALTAANTRRTLENVRTNDALRPRFEVINNQCVVLLVSLFASAVGELYREAMLSLAKSGGSNKLNDESLEFSVTDIMTEDFNPREQIGSLMQEKKDVSFQDMKSIGRAFTEFFGTTIPKDEIVNNLIVAQASRHIIVHDGAKINDRFMRQIQTAMPRTLKPRIESVSTIHFDEAELRIIGDSMFKYFSCLRIQVEKSLQNGS